MNENYNYTNKCKFLFAFFFEQSNPHSHFLKTNTFIFFLMLYPINNREDLHKLDSYIHTLLHTIFKPMTDAIKNNSENITKTLNQKIKVNSD